MSYLRFVARRAAFAVFSAYVVITAAFFIADLMVKKQLSEQLAIARYGGADPEELERLRTSFIGRRGLEPPLYERYVDWLVNVATFEFGFSFAYRKPVLEVLKDVVPTTLAYVLPGVALAVLLGVALGLFAALAKDGAFDTSVRAGVYALLGVPAFMVIIYYHYLSGQGLGTVAGVDLVAPTLSPTVLAALTVATSLLAGQLRFARTAALEQTGRAFVKLLRAKGAGRVRLARHVLRNSAVPIVSLSMSELLAVLMLDIYIIEAVLPITGLASASLRAVRAGDTALIIWTSLVLVFIGIAGNFLQDVTYGYLDPRIGTT